MYFCEKCRYLYNITKDVKNKQFGGKINDALTALLNKYNNNIHIEEKDLKKLNGRDLKYDDRYDGMSKKEQKKLISLIKSIDKSFFVEEQVVEPKIGSNSAYFICKYCKYSKPIKPGTLIYSKNYNTNSSSEIDDYTYAIYDQTLPRVRNYICKNSKCESHKNDSVREAVLTKNTSDQIVYICTSCSTNWINIL